MGAGNCVSNRCLVLKGTTNERWGAGEGGRESEGEREGRHDQLNWNRGYDWGLGGREEERNTTLCKKTGWQRNGETC